MKRHLLKLVIIAAVLISLSGNQIAGAFDQDFLKTRLNSPGIGEKGVDSSEAAVLSSSIENSEIRLTVFDTGQFTLELLDGRDLLYPASTSVLSVKVGTAIYENNTGTLTMITSPYIVGGDTIITVYQTPEGVGITQYLKLVGPALEIKLETQNNGSTPYLVEARLLLDTQVAYNDGSPIYIPGLGVRTLETQIDNPSFSTWFGYDQYPTPNLISEGTLLDMPYRMLIAYWPDAYGTDTNWWDYSIDPSQSITSDSSVLLYYSLGSLNPGVAKTFRTYYGTDAPEAFDDLDRLLNALDAAHAALQSKMASDADKIAFTLAYAYKVVYGESVVDSIILPFFDGAIDLGSLAAEMEYGDGTPNTVGLMFVKVIEEAMVEGITEDIRSRLSAALTYIFRDAHLDPNSPTLQAEIKEILLNNSSGPQLAVRQAEIEAQYQAFRDDLVAQYSAGLPVDFPIEDVLRILSRYQDQITSSSQEEVTLGWIDPGYNSYEFQKFGTPSTWSNIAIQLGNNLDAEARFKNLGWGIIAGAGVAKLGLAVATGGFSAVGETILFVGGVTAFGFNTAGDVVDLATKEMYSLVAVGSTATLQNELNIAGTSLAEMLQFVDNTLSSPTSWQNIAGEIISIQMQDLVQDEEGEIAPGTGSVTVRNTGSQTVNVNAFVDILGPPSTNHEIVGTVQNISDLSVLPGETTTLTFEYTLPYCVSWDELFRYSAEIHVAFGPRIVSSLDYAEFAENTSFFVGTMDAYLANLQQTFETIQIGQIDTGQVIAGAVTPPPEATITHVTLNWPGSDLDLHLYDALDRHVGVNYSTGLVEMEIPGVTYSGPNAHPEWMSIAAPSGDTFYTEVVGVNLSETEPFQIQAVHTPSYPAILGIEEPGTYAAFTPGEGGLVSFRFTIKEYGLNTGVANLALHTTDLVGSGTTIPAGNVSVEVQQSWLDAGGTQTILGTILVPETTPADTYAGTITVTGTDSATSNPIEATIRLDLIETPQSRNYKAYLPFIANRFQTQSGPYMEGTVTDTGVPVANTEVVLRYYNGANFSTYATTTTDSNGHYQFSNLPPMISNEILYVRWINTESDSSRLSAWYCEYIYVDSDPSLYSCNFDLQNIALLSPSPGASISLPYTFQWSVRAFTSDNYELNLADRTDYDPYWWSSFGYVGSYTMSSLPAGFSPGVSYGWWMWVYGPDGHGVSYYYRTVTFLNSGTASQSEQVPLLSALDAQRLEELALLHWQR